MNAEIHNFIVEVTTSGAEESKKIGRQMVEERLAACANILATVHSFYWWKDKLEEDSESILLLKTVEEKIPLLINRIKELHSYENPAIIVLPIVAGSEEYFKWIEKETSM